MPEVTLFCEDSLHQQFVGALLQRFEREYGMPVHARFLSARGGLSQIHREFKEFLRDLDRSLGLFLRTLKALFNKWMK